MVNRLSLTVTTTLALEAKHLRDPLVLWASGAGLGFLPRAPGTWGSVGAVAVWWLLLADLTTNMQLAVCTGYFLVSWLCSHLIGRRYAVSDAPEIIADEVVGMWVALALLPAVWWLVVLAFVGFRWLDIAKPGPIGWLDREVKGGLGVMLDDLVAGLVVGSVLYLSIWGLTTAGFNPLGL
jgi:phosphatidylglycerophosphatase A